MRSSPTLRTAASVPGSVQVPSSSKTPRTFATEIASPAALDYDVVYNLNDVMITITAVPFATFATTPNQAGVASVLDTIRDGAAADDLR